MKPYYLVALISIAMPVVVLFTTFLDEPAKWIVATALLVVGAILNSMFFLRHRRSKLR